MVRVVHHMIVWSHENRALWCGPMHGGTRMIWIGHMGCVICICVTFAAMCGVFCIIAMACVCRNLMRWNTKEFVDCVVVATERARVTAGYYTEERINEIERSTMKKAMDERLDSGSLQYSIISMIRNPNDAWKQQRRNYREGLAEDALHRLGDKALGVIDGHEDRHSRISHDLPTPCSRLISYPG